MKASKTHIIVLAAVLLIFSALNLNAAVRTASVSGNWSSTATWGGQSVPTSNDDVTILEGITVTVDIAAECATLTIQAASGNDGVITISASNSLTVTGLINMERPSNNNTSCIINVNAGTVTCGSLTMNSTTTTRNNVINFTTGTFNVTGAITTGTTGCQINFTGTGTMNLAGNVSGNPTLTMVTGATVNYTGTTPQNVFSGSYDGNLGISGSNYKTLTAATTVNGGLVLDGGILENDTYLTIGDGSSISKSQGVLTQVPTFAGTVNLDYTGASAVTTAYEMPTASGVLNDLTTNSGGVIQGGTPGAIVNILTDAFGNTNNWTGDIGRNNNQFRRRNTSNAGGSGREIRYLYGTSSSTSYEASMYRMVSTAGYSSVNIKWKQFIDNFDADTYSYTIKLQCATSSSGPWTDMYSYTPSGSADIGPEIPRISNWTTNVGGDFYIRFNISGYTFGLDYWYFDDLIVDGQDPTVPSTVTVNGALDLSSGEYSIEDNTLALAGTVSGSSDIVGGTTSNLTVSGTGSNLTLPDINGGLGNFTISRGNGVSLANDLTVNGILNLQSSNPSATLGLLETVTDTLTMAEPATTTGAGDVTGYVKRTSFTPNTVYSFGNEFTDIIFAAGGTLPDQICVNISIGVAPSWLPTAIERVYDFVNTGGAGLNATISTHYLDSELNSLNENNLVQYTYGTPGPPPGLYPWGKSGNNTTDNWVTIANVGIENFPTTFGQLENTLAAPPAAEFVWYGVTSSDWATTTNWTPNGTPGSASNIVIPNTSTTNNDPTIPATASINSIRIEPGAIINTVAGAALTLNGANGAWANEGGTFNPGTSNVSFTNAAATVAGTTNFYDLTVANGASLTPAVDCHMGIANAITLTGTAVLYGELLHNTIEYNGGSQTVINPNGATAGYHNLMLSGTGTKTMPGTDLSIAGELTLSGSSSATAASALTIGESVTIGASNTLDLSTYSHSIGGDLTNNGTLTSSSSSLTFDGSVEQTITNSAGLSVDDLNISNTTESVILGTSTDCSVAGDLTIATDAIFDLGANTLSAVTGSIPGAGTLRTQNTSSTPLPTGKTWVGELEFYGAAAQTLVLGTYNDVTVNNAAGVEASADVTINGLISLPNANASSSKGALDMGTYTATLGPSSTSSGIGEVSGIMKRTTLLPDVTYTFGHTHTHVNFPDVGTLPTEVSVKLTLGAAPAWKPEAMDRIYDLAQVGGTGTQAILHSHYLDSELNGNIEDNVVDWVQFLSVPVIIEYGRSSIETSENYLVISNVNMGVFAPVFGFNEICFSEAELTALTWTGAVSTSWVTAQNWSPLGAPSDNVDVTIPDASGTTFDPDIPAVAVCKSITIESGGILNTSSNGELTIDGDATSWSNSGSFNPGTSTIVFNGANTTLTGSHEFHNIVIEQDAGLYLQSGTYLGVTGNITNLGTLGATEDGPTTIEYKGADQIIPSTERLSNTYSEMLISGSGTKTLPSVPMVVEDMKISGTATAVSDTSITFNDTLSIGSGAGFTTGIHRHTLLGEYINNGTLTATGSNITFGGTSAQTLSGTSANTFDSLTINNALGVSLESDALYTVSGALTINNGMLLELPPTKQLTVSGTLTNSSDETGFVIQSDATGTGSLIHGTAGMAATVERYIEADHWHIVSPAVTGQTVPAFVTDAANNIPTQGANYGMMTYSESAGNYVYYTNPASGNMLPGSGYLLRHTTDDAVSTYGDLSYSSTDVAITRDGFGWNAVGNPFACPIGVREDATSSEDFLTYNAAAFDPSYASLYLWDEPDVFVAGIDYYKVISNAAFTPSRPILDMTYLKPGQGFIMKSASGGATVTFTAAMRVHDHTEVFVKKAERKSWPGIVLSIENDGKSASTSITFNGNMTTALDVTYDAGLLGGDRNFRLYSRLIDDNGVNFMLQCLPDYDFDNMIVPLGFDCSTLGEIRFSAEAFDLPFGCGVILEDRKMGIFTDLLSDSSYNVTLDSAATGVGRFYLHFAEEEEASGIKQKNGEVIDVYYFDRKITVKGSLSNQTRARLVDLSGKVLKNFELEDKYLNTLPADNLSPGVYVLNIYGNNLYQSTRIFVD